MNIELQVKNLFANASQLDEAGFIADFYYIAKEFARQQNGAKPDVSGSLPLAELLDGLRYIEANIDNQESKYEWIWRTVYPLLCKHDKTFRDYSGNDR